HSASGGGIATLARNLPSQVLAVCPGRPGLLPVGLDADLDGEGLAGAADEDRAAGRGGVEPVAADRGADVVGLGQDAVGRVEALPAELGEVELDPGVRGLALALVRLELGGLGAGVDVTADVACGDDEQAGEADEQVGEVLAHAEAVDVDVER